MIRLPTSPTIRRISPLRLALIRTRPTSRQRSSKHCQTTERNKFRRLQELENDYGSQKRLFHLRNGGEKTLLLGLETLDD